MRLLSVEETVKMIPDGAVVMVGGFLGVGSPNALIDEIVRQKRSSITIIANDTAFPDRGVGKIIVNKLAKKVIVSHIGTNPETQKQMIEGSIEVELVPQGTLVEKIRAGGLGLGGILTPTGVGTIIAEGKQIMNIEGKDYMLELPLKADFAIIKAKRADCNGNLVYSLTARNFNPIMATAASTVIAEVEEILPVGTIPPDEVHTPGIFIDYIVKGR
ncbi:CoA transferase subunit A [Athalassotoga saccharophila]|uniref:CoA transferase subunit A n=1 Tax=Athalassotoga saccharophila TaxID=1441386 RepID=UPI00137B1FF0|nr:3-oxoacid CoA-transferase subunit A [Athalassotoga saccharophila]BBJ28856.1 butyrate--acetoacetate CoA-transferase subunit A [Athalassotoga saccharophila]